MNYLSKMCILFPIFSVIIISCSDSNKNDKNQKYTSEKHDDSRNFFYSSWNGSWSMFNNSYWKINGYGTKVQLNLTKVARFSATNNDLKDQEFNFTFENGGNYSKDMECKCIGDFFGNEAKGLITIKSCTEVWSKYTGNINPQPTLPDPAVMCSNLTTVNSGKLEYSTVGTDNLPSIQGLKIYDNNQNIISLSR